VHGRTGTGVGQGNTGTISRHGPRRPLPAVGCRRGPVALSFNGASSWGVTVADAASLDSDQTGMTIEAWVIRGRWHRGLADSSVAAKGSHAGVLALLGANNASRPAAYVHTSGDIGPRRDGGRAAQHLDAPALTYDGHHARILRQRRAGETAAHWRLGYRHVRRAADWCNSVWGEYFRGLIDESPTTTGR